MKRNKRGFSPIILGIIILAIVLLGAVVISMKLVNNSDSTSSSANNNEIETGISSSNKELIPVYNSEKKAYGLIDVTGKVVLDFKYDKITEEYNTFKLEKDEKVTYVTKNNKSLKKYKECSFEESQLNSINVIIAKDDSKMYIINQNGKEIYSMNRETIRNMHDKKTSLGILTYISTDSKEIIVNNENLICEVSKKEFYCSADNYITLEKDGVFTTKQYDNNGKVIKTIENEGMLDYTDNYYVLCGNLEKRGYSNVGTAKVYLHDGTFVAEAFYNGTKSECYVIQDDLLLISSSDNNTTRASIYKNGVKMKDLDNHWVDNGGSIVNGIISLESTDDYKTYYYDEKGNRISDIDIENNSYGSVYANYFNGYIYKGFDNESNAKVLDAKTGEVKIDNLWYDSINNQLIPNTNGKYMIVTTSDDKSAIVNDKLEIVVDYAEGIFTYFNIGNPYGYDKDTIYFIKKIDGSEVSLIAYDLTDNCKVKFELNGRWHDNGLSYIGMMENYSTYKYYDLNGKLIY